MKPPASVQRAVSLIVINTMLLMYIFSEKLPGSTIPVEHHESESSLIAVMLVFAAILLGLAYAIYRGKNWARITVTAFAAYCAWRIAGDPHYQRWIDVVTLAFGVIWIVAIYCLFAEESSKWFRKPKAGVS